MLAATPIHSPYETILRRPRPLHHPNRHILPALHHRFRTREQSLLLPLVLSSHIPIQPLLCPPSPLLQQSVSRLAQVAHLSLLHTLQVVADSRAEAGVDGIDPGLGEERSHFDAELPEADSEACDSRELVRGYGHGHVSKSVCIPKPDQKRILFTMTAGLSTERRASWDLRESEGGEGPGWLGPV